MPALNETIKSTRPRIKTIKSSVELLKWYIDQNPGWPPDQLYAYVKNALLHPDMEDELDEILKEWFVKNFTDLTRPPPVPRDRSAEKARIRAEVEVIKERHKKKVEAEVHAVLLDMVLPHGKQLRHSTGAECAKLGPKIGAWLSRIGSEVRPRQVVGNVLSEEQVRQLYAG